MESEELKILGMIPKNSYENINDLSKKLSIPKKELLAKYDHLQQLGYVTIKKPFLRAHRISLTNQEIEGVDCKVISIINHKGGVGKTSISFNLAAAINSLGKRVLLIDVDPQGNLSLILKGNENGLYQLINGQEAQTVITHTTWAGLDLISHGEGLAGAEVELVNKPEREFVIKSVIDKIKKFYDFIILDCPPSISLLSINALTASSKVIIPVECSVFGLESAQKTLKTIKLLSERLNPGIMETLILPNKFNTKDDFSTKVEEELRKKIPQMLTIINLSYDEQIPKSLRKANPVIYLDSKSKTTENLIKLSRRLITNEGK